MAGVGEELDENTPFGADWQSMVALVIVFISSAFANTAGVGGGFIFVPMFNILMNFPLKTSTALSQMVIALGDRRLSTLGCR